MLVLRLVHGMSKLYTSIQYGHIIYSSLGPVHVEFSFKPPISLFYLAQVWFTLLEVGSSYLSSVHIELWLAHARFSWIPYFLDPT